MLTLISYATAAAKVLAVVFDVVVYCFAVVGVAAVWRKFF